MERVAPMIWAGFGSLMVAGLLNSDWNGPGSFMVFCATILFAWGSFMEARR